MSSPVFNSPAITHLGGWHLDHSYARLPQIFFESVAPDPVRSPALVIFNEPLARELGLDAEALQSADGAAIFSGNRLPPGSQPIAQAYAGHQYGHFTGLGDGRAVLLGEQIAPDGQRFDVQLKGSGRTPFSRGGDGRAALGPMLREYIISEAMQALGIPTTRSLAVTGTGQAVYREDALPGAVLTRIAASHIRVGTMQWAAARGGVEEITALMKYTLERHFPGVLDGEKLSAAQSASALLEGVMERQASLLAKWMQVGFVHGVMNTDNMALSGETIDYGPCAFMDSYDPETVFSSIDRNGRYAYGNQPRIANWNLARLAEALLPVLDPDEQTALAIANQAIQRFASLYGRQWLTAFRGKVGLATEQDGDQALIEDLLQRMHRAKADYTNTFAALTCGQPLGNADLELWREHWQERLKSENQTTAAARERMRQFNPAVIPRNHQVEAALQAANSQGDLAPLQRLLAVLQNPFAHGSVPEEFCQAAPEGSCRYRTFCGT